MHLDRWVHAKNVYRFNDAPKVNFFSEIYGVCSSFHYNVIIVSNCIRIFSLYVLWLLAYVV